MINSKIVRCIHDSIWEEIWELYNSSFPIFERRILSNQIDAIKNDRFNCKTYFEDETLVGILFYWEYKNYKYIEHFAINEYLRGKKYGSKILQDFCDDNKTIILEIDPIVDEISKRRLMFYENIGFKLNNIVHIHPPYRKGYKGHNLKVLSYKRKLDLLEYNEFNKFLQDEVMRYSD
ncbi:GNAT family N-acetyltransferase [Clostridium sp.]|uniref:GNAT family N-acetyltransferase n=1 Tax=Clostridium sp. TaxID=1506 RepID=UPI0025BE1846|nr:GNAT family N-acetyltransferase [Clostridium sp.]